MKFTIYFSLISFLLLILFSCSEANVMLYHPQDEEEPGKEPQDTWLLTQINYAKEGILPYSVDSQRFSYDDKDRIVGIKNLRTNLITTVRYDTDKIVISKFSVLSTLTNYDTIFIKLNDKHQIISATHASYSGITNPTPETVNERTRKDSTAFFYDDANYLKRLDHYIPSGSSYMFYYQEEFTVEDGNIVQVKNKAGHTHSYTYDDEEHNHDAEFCYEMPRNRSYPGSQCWLFSLFPIISDYLGTPSKNNVNHVEISYTQNQPSWYSNISYNYIFDDNKLLDEVLMSGIIGSDKIFNNSVMTFTHSKK